MWQDDGNGIQDTGEPSINGVTVVLKDNNNNVIGSTVTGPNPGNPSQGGYYQFTNLCAGTYRVSIDNTQSALTGFVPTNAPDSTPNNDSNPNPSTVILTTNNSVDESIDFGYVCERQAGIIGGVNLGGLANNYLFFFGNGSKDANWQGATKGFAGNVLVDGILASERVRRRLSRHATTFLLSS